MFMLTNDTDNLKTERSLSGAVNWVCRGYRLDRIIKKLLYMFDLYGEDPPPLLSQRKTHTWSCWDFTAIQTNKLLMLRVGWESCEQDDNVSNLQRDHFSRHLIRLTIFKIIFTLPMLPAAFRNQNLHWFQFIQEDGRTIYMPTALNSLCSRYGL